MENIEKGIPAGHQPCNSSYECICGSKILHKNRTQHFKSAKHQKYLKSIVMPPRDNLCIIIEEPEETATTN
jgi:predicted ATPase with chaperone activity